jgi:glucan-binding YG repeat protein
MRDKVEIWMTMIWNRIVKMKVYSVFMIVMQIVKKIYTEMMVHEKKTKVVFDVDADVIENNICHQATSSMKDTTHLNLDVLDDSNDNDSVFDSNNASKNNSSNISSLSDNLPEVSTKQNKVASTISVPTSTSASRFRRKKVDATKSISPAIARKMQRSLLTSHQKQINNKKKKAKITGLTDKEEEKSFLRETRESKMMFEQQVHDDDELYYENSSAEQKCSKSTEFSKSYNFCIPVEFFI